MKILFGCLAALGDVVYNTAIARKVWLEHKKPVRLYWGVLRQFSPVLLQNPYVYRVIAFNGPVKPIEPTWEKLKALAPHYDMAVLPQIYPDHHERYLDPDCDLDYLSLCAENAGLKSFVKGMYRKPFVFQLPYRGQLPSKFFTLSHVSFTRPPVWSAEQYLELISHLSYPTVVLCRPGEPTLEHPKAFMVQDATINQVAWIIERSEGFIGLDSGLTAVAASTEVPFILTLHTDEPLIFKRMALINTGAAPTNSVECLVTPTVEEVVRAVSQLRRRRTLFYV